jgi:hypothetical protein
LRAVVTAATPPPRPPPLQWGARDPGRRLTAMITPKYTWWEDASCVFIRLDGTGVRDQHQVFCSDSVIKINAAPYFLLLDLHSEVDDEASSAAISPDSLLLTLRKVRRAGGRAFDRMRLPPSSGGSRAPQASEQPPHPPVEASGPAPAAGSVPCGGTPCRRPRAPGGGSRQWATSRPSCSGARLQLHGPTPERRQLTSSAWEESRRRKGACPFGPGGGRGRGRCMLRACVRAHALALQHPQTRRAWPCIAWTTVLGSLG